MLFPALMGLLLSFNCQRATSPIYPFTVIEVNEQSARASAEKIRDEVAVELAEGLELSLWASDSLITDPIAIGTHPDGGIYYTNGTRLEHSEFDIRGHRDWMTASISFQSVEDRRAFLRETFAPEKSEENKQMMEDLNGDSSHDWRDLTVEKESVWYLEDRSGDGIADRAQLYIEDFHEEISDLANGVEYFDDQVFVSVGPDLWRTWDEDGDGIADGKESLAHGFAVHIGFGAHGMSGVTVGPQGRIWWGIGDIGANVTDKDGRQWKYPNQGVIVRCDPDGSNFEVFAAGLRNTHEFVFDQYGNLISEDNDGDHAGERERLVYITNGSDGGWRINWQFGKYTDPNNNDYKVWMDERLNVPRWEGQAAYITPPIINYVNGPTGMVYNPGTALGERWANHFFIAEFRGTPANSPLHAFTLKPDGASFALDQTAAIVKGLLPTGVDFGSDGALYFADWIDGWGVKEQGRLWKLDVPEGMRHPKRQETQTLLQSDFSDKSPADLQGLLGHADMRVRQKAQFALVKLGDADALAGAVSEGTEQLARIHGLWGLAQMARADIKHAAHLPASLSDDDPEIQAQAAKMIGDVRYEGAEEALIGLLRHPSLRVQFFAAEALGRTAAQTAAQPIIDMLLANDDQDAWLRHAGCLALARIGQPEPLIALADHASSAIRIAAVVALRRMKHSGIATFLQDAEEYIVTEAARGINDDFSIDDALPALASLLSETSFEGEPLIRRAINANLRVGKPENIDHLKNYILRTSAPEAMRAEALAALSTWPDRSPLDRVDGRYRGTETRDAAPVTAALSSMLPSLLSASSQGMVLAAIDAAQRLKLAEVSDEIAKLAYSGSAAEMKLAALDYLQHIEYGEMASVLESALSSRDDAVRAKALSIIPSANMDNAKAVALYSTVLQRGQTKEKQAALTGLGNLGGPAAHDLIAEQLKKLLAGDLPPSLQLEAVEAAEAMEDDDIQALVAEIKQGYGDDPIAAFLPALEGGDERAGGQIFYRHEAAQCVRCHSIWEWGGDAGPGLMGVGERLSKEKILESMIRPSADLAPGYAVVSLELNDEKIVAGTLIEETEQSITLKTGQGEEVQVSKAEVKDRQDIPSSMPSVEEILSVREIRDLVAFLSALKDDLQPSFFQSD